jgi:DNA polymerase I-like protein with 3'-5' exonuclease and polymerase domains
MTVHDSIVLEAPDHLVDEAARTARAMMLQWPSGVVNLHVDVEVGQDWGHLEKYDVTKNAATP